MSETTWVKACDCPSMTASYGRLVITQEPVADGPARITSAFHPGPVCDTCDTPWALRAPQPEGDRP